MVPRTDPYLIINGGASQFRVGENPEKKDQAKSTHEFHKGDPLKASPENRGFSVFYTKFFIVINAARNHAEQWRK